MATAIGFVDFVEQVLKVKLTVGQRTLARIAFDGVDPVALDEEERRMAERLLGPVATIPPEARLTLCLVKGARIGGSYIFGGLYSLWRALTADLCTLAKGEQAVALIVAPDIRLARQVLRYAVGAAEDAPTINRLIETKSADSFSIVRPNDQARVSIECLPATRGGSAVRGRSLVSAVLSETAFFRDASAIINDADVFRAVMPRVMPGGITVLESTPWVEAGLLHEEFSRNYGDPRSAIAAHCPTLVMRPDERTATIVANERARDPDNAEREFDAQFISGGSGLFFGPELLRPALVDIPVLESALPDARMRIGGDIGLVSDATAFCAVARLEHEIRLCNVMEIRPPKGAPLKLSEVVAHGCEFANRFGEHRITVDHHELTAAREHLPNEYELTACAGGGDAKTDRFLKVRDAFREGRIKIPTALVRLTNQLSLVVSRPRPGGGTSIVLPRRAGTHLDLAAAFILAAEAALEEQATSSEAWAAWRKVAVGWAW